jgi:hypothetical protein
VRRAFLAERLWCSSKSERTNARCELATWRHRHEYEQAAPAVTPCRREGTVLTRDRQRVTPRATACREGCTLRPVYPCLSPCCRVTCICISDSCIPRYAHFSHRAHSRATLYKMAHQSSLVPNSVKNRAYPHLPYKLRLKHYESPAPTSRPATQFHQSGPKT